MDSLFTHTPFVPLLDASDLLVLPLVLLLPCPLKLFLVLPPLKFLVVDCCCPMAGRARTLFDGPGLGLRRPAEGLGTNCDGLAGKLGLSVSVDSPNTSASRFWLPPALLTNFVDGDLGVLIRGGKALGGLREGGILLVAVFCGTGLCPPVRLPC